VTTLPVSSGFTVNAGSPTQLVWTQQPSNVAAGGTMSPAVTVTVEDANNNVVTTASGTVTLALTTPGGATLTGGGPITVSSGVATFGSLSVNLANTYTFTPSTTVSGVTTLPVSSSFTVGAGAATKLVWTQQPPATVAAGGTMSPAVTVTVEDANNNVVTGASGNVTLALTTPGGATLTGGGPITVSSGVATFGGLSVNKTGSYTFTPSTTVSGVTTLPVSSSFTVNPGSPTQLVWTQQPSAVTAGVNMNPAPAVAVEDANGNVVTGAVGNVTLVLTTPAGATLTGGGPATVTSGVATFSSLNVNLANSYTFTPSTNVAGVTTLPVSGSFTVSAASASTIAVNDGDSQSATAGTAVTTPPSVIVKDQFGNAVSGVSVTFAVGLGGGTVVPTTAITTDAGGIARVTSWTLGSTPGANTLTATSGSLSGSPVTFNATGL